MLSETSTTITPVEPLGTIVWRCVSSERAEATVARSAATAAAASTSRTSLVRRTTPRSSATSCVSIATLRRRRIVLPLLLGVRLCLALEVLTSACGETDRLAGCGLARAPRQGTRRSRERSVVVVEVLRDELERAAALGRTVHRAGLLEQRERTFERRQVGRRRRRGRLRRRRLLLLRQRRVRKPAPADQKQRGAAEQERDQQSGRQAVRRGGQRREICAPGGP